MILDSAAKNEAWKHEQICCRLFFSGLNLGNQNLLEKTHARKPWILASYIHRKPTIDIGLCGSWRSWKWNQYITETNKWKFSYFRMTQYLKNVKCNYVFIFSIQVKGAGMRSMTLGLWLGSFGLGTLAWGLYVGILRSWVWRDGLLRLGEPPGRMLGESPALVSFARSLRSCVRNLPGKPDKGIVQVADHKCVLAPICARVVIQFFEFCTFWLRKHNVISKRSLCTMEIPR